MLYLSRLAGVVCLCAIIFCPNLVHAQVLGPIVSWGRNVEGQLVVPPPNDDFIQIEAGDVHGVGLRSDGTVAAWGENIYNQCEIYQPNQDFVAIAAGGYHTLGLLSDG